MKLGFSVCLLACLAACRSTGSPVEERAAAAVAAELERYYQDLSARDWEAFADHFWPGATLTTVWKPAGEERPRVFAASVPEFISAAARGPGSASIFEERATGIAVRMHGALAQAWARYEVRFGEPEDLAEWSGVDAVTLLFHEGRWRIVSIAYVSEG